MRIKNRAELVQNASCDVDRRARTLILDTFEAALDAVDPKKVVKSKVSFEKSKLKINGFTVNLDLFERVFVVGAGKASGLMAQVLEEILGSRIDGGVIIVPYRASSCKLRTAKVVEAAHPIPDEKSVEGAKEILKIAEELREKDLLLCLFSGGGSSLMTLPREGITLEEKRQLTERLLKSGASINEINAVRKHISNIKGGLLAEKAYPATILNLIISDVVGDDYSVIASGPTVPDQSTFTDAIKTLKNYGLWKETPKSVRKILLKGKNGQLKETPKPNEEIFKKVHSFILANNRTACLAALEKLEKSGLNTLFLTSHLEGEARQAGATLAAVAKEIVSSGYPISKPAAVVAGGETTVKVKGEGKGGRNQELVLSAALKINGLKGVAIGSVDTDGIDGPTPAAGAISDGETVIRAERMGLKAKAFLEENNSYEFFSKIKDAIITGSTGTNVNDITILVVL